MIRISSEGDEFLPVTEKGFEYQMPDGIRDQLTKEFLYTLHENIARIFKMSMDEMDNVNHYSMLGGTGGWHEALKIASDQYNKSWLYDYYCHLPWYESDIFGYEVFEEMVKCEVIPEGVPYDDEDFLEDDEIEIKEEGEG